MSSSLTNLKSLLFFYFSAMTIIMSYLPIFFQNNGLTGAQIGFLLAAGPFASIFAQPFWGYLTDKYDTSKGIIIFCIVGSIISAVPMFFTFHYPFLIVTVFIFFSFMSPIGGLGDSLAQKTAARLSLSFGSIRMWGSIGFATMSLLIGYVLAITGVQYMYIPFLLFALITFVFALKVEDVKTFTKQPIHLLEALKIGKNTRFIRFIFMMLFITVTHRANDSFMGIYIVEKGGDEALIGWAWFVGVISEAVIFATATYWFQRFHALTFMIFSSFIFTIRWLVMGVLQEPLLILPLQIMHGLSFGIFYLCAFQYIADLMPHHLRGTGHLLFYSFFFGISGVIGSAVGGQLIEMHNASFLYTQLACVSFAGGILLFLYKLYYNKQSMH